MNCPSCQSENVKKRAKANSWRYLACKDCGAFFKQLEPEFIPPPAYFYLLNVDPVPSVVKNQPYFDNSYILPIFEDCCDTVNCKFCPVKENCVRLFDEKFC